MVSTEFNVLVQFLADRYDLPQQLLIAAAFAIGIGWVCWRTRSTHIVIARK